MKILYALVGYLAVTVLPFAFASPLPVAAIDYDGYVNTTQHHSDSSLMKRVPGNIIKARQWVAVAPVFLAIDAIIAAVTLSVVWVESDEPVRGNDLEFLVEYVD